MIRPVSGKAFSASAKNVEELAQSYGDWIGIRSNHVVTSKGEFVDSIGSSRGISTPEDRELLLALRNRADLVIVDSKTARSEGYHPLRKSKLGIISRSGNFTGLENLSDSPNVFFFSSSAKTPQSVTLVNPEDPFLDLLHWANDKDLVKVLLEAGPTLSGKAFSMDRVEQAALTITPNVDVSSVKLPFESNLSLSSFAQGEGASFTLWGR